MGKAFMVVLVGVSLILGSIGSAGAQTSKSGETTLVLAAAESPLEGVNEIIHMESSHLLFLGAGLVGGALYIGPQLGLSELLGVALGVIASEWLYRAVYKPRFSFW